MSDAGGGAPAAAHPGGPKKPPTKQERAVLAARAMADQPLTDKMVDSLRIFGGELSDVCVIAGHQQFVGLNVVDLYTPSQQVRKFVSLLAATVRSDPRTLLLSYFR